jgi:hypothetical protein
MHQRRYFSIKNIMTTSNQQGDANEAFFQRYIEARSPQGQ